MTILVTESQSPSSDIVKDAKAIADKTNARRVVVEDAIDNNWFIRVEGPANGGDAPYSMTERELEGLTSTVRDVVGGTHSSLEPFHGIGEGGDYYLIRIEY